MLRILGAVAALTFAVYLYPATLGHHPSGIIGATLVPEIENQPRWHTSYEEAWQDAVRRDKPIFIFFTAVTDVGSRFVEIEILDSSEVKAELEAYSLAILPTDLIPDANLTRDESRKIAEWNQQLYGAVSAEPYVTPGFVIINPTADTPFDSGQPRGVVIASRQGVVRDKAAFAKWLKSHRP